MSFQTEDTFSLQALSTKKVLKLLAAEPTRNPNSYHEDKTGSFF